MRTFTVVKVIALTSALGVTAAQAQDTDIGADLYTDYCAACHGASGKGDGDMANVMTIPSPNLTQLAKDNDGAFPMLQVIHVIDGRTGVRAHGGVMPVFGTVFQTQADKDTGGYGAVLESRGRVLSLAMYLESIQE